MTSLCFREEDNTGTFSEYGTIFCPMPVTASQMRFSQKEHERIEEPVL